MAPWADLLFAMDSKWWKVYLDDVRQAFEGERVSSTGVDDVRTIRFDHFGNSGAAAIALAVMRGAEKITLVGYDCKTRNKVHWHGDHPRGLGNAGSISKWPDHFSRLAKTHPQIDIVNCSPGTALTCFPVMGLAEALTR